LAKYYRIIVSEQEIVSYLKNHLHELIPGIHATKEEVSLPLGKLVDIHARDRKGRDVFVEFKPEFKIRDIGRIIDYSSAVANSETKNPRLILLGFRASPEVRKALRRLAVEFVPLSSLEVPKEILGQWTAKLQFERERNLPPEEAKLGSYLQSREAALVAVQDLARYLNVSRNYASQLAVRLSRRGWLDRIAAGRYLYIPIEHGYEQRFPPMSPFVAGSVLVEPYYFGFGTANSYYGFTPQSRSTFYIATTLRKEPIAWRGISYRFVHLGLHQFFGFRLVLRDGRTVQMSVPEKTIVDPIHRPNFSGGMPEIVQAIVRSSGKIDQSRMVRFGISMRSKSLVQRLGYLLEILSTEGLLSFDSRLRSRLEDSIGSSPVHLGSVAKYGSKGHYNSAWRIYRNIPMSDLLGEVRVR